MERDREANVEPEERGETEVESVLSLPFPQGRQSANSLGWNTKGKWIRELDREDGQDAGHAGLGAVGYRIQETLNILLAVLHSALLPDHLGRVVTELAPSCGRGLGRGGAPRGRGSAEAGPRWETPLQSTLSFQLEPLSKR